MVTPVIVPISPTNNNNNNNKNNKNIRRINSLSPSNRNGNNTHSNNRTGGSGGVVISNCVLCIIVLSAFSLFVSIEYGQILPSMMVGNNISNNNNNNNNNIKRQTTSSSSYYSASSSAGGGNSIITSPYIRTSPTATYSGSSSSSSNNYYGKEQDEQRQDQEQAQEFYYAPEYNAFGSSETPPTHKLPRVVLLISFPNSHGIAYTLREVKIATHTTTATTFWGEFDDKPDPIIPYIKSPYQLEPELPVPSLVLTKTHCAADCLTCIPPSLANVHEFQKGCRSFTAKGTSGEMAGQFIQEHFAEALVSKVVHFVRSPFDTVLDRMKSGVNALRNSHRKIWTDDKLSRFNATTDGIIAWCNDLDRSVSNDTDFDSIMRERGIPEELYQNLPCKTEWYRYTQFHNLALEAIDEMQTPAYVLYYENYGKKFRKTVRELLNFLERAQVDNFLELPGAGRTLVERYGDDFGKATAQFVKAAASPECWSLIKHYFNQWKIEEDVTVS